MFQEEPGETNLFGDENIRYMSYSEYSWEHVDDAIPGVGRKNTGLSWQEFLATDTGKAVLEQVRLVNVFTFLKDETSVPALYWYVRYGLRDRDSSFAIETMLYYGMLGKKGILDRNFRLAYLFHHSGDYDVIEAYDWLQEKLKEAGEPA